MAQSNWFTRWRAARHGIEGFLKTSEAQRRIVFYSEDNPTWAHFEPILRELTGPLGQTTCYLTSSLDDPAFSAGIPLLLPFYIGDGYGRTSLFLNLKAGVMALTLPDLERLYLKRSRVHPVHYVYLFHSLISAHASYHAHAFAHYDTILAAGPHHVAEIRETEKLYGLKPKTVLEHGYAKLDALMAVDRGKTGGVRKLGEPLKILVAPSWGRQALLETAGEQVIETLLAAAFSVALRPHPMTMLHNRPLITRMQKRWASNPKLTWDQNAGSLQSLIEADILVTDWSGTAFEFALGLERPVIFINTPQKVNNPQWDRISHRPVELALRESLGFLVNPGRLELLAPAIERAVLESPARVRRLEELRSLTVFNAGHSAAVGARHITHIANTVNF